MASRAACAVQGQIVIPMLAHERFNAMLQFDSNATHFNHDGGTLHMHRRCTTSMALPCEAAEPSNAHIRSNTACIIQSFHLNLIFLHGLCMAVDFVNCEIKVHS